MTEQMDPDDPDGDMDSSGSSDHVDPETAALIGAVERAPEDVYLRSMLCDRLLGAGADARARDEARHVLASVPDNLTALRVAATSSERLGELELAMSYWKLHDALSAGTPDSGHTTPPPPVTSSGYEASVAPGLSPGAVPASGPGEGDDDFALSALDFEDTVGMTLDDVAGMDDVKRRLHSMFLAPLTNPQLREMYGTELRGGLLLYGPPGCGKTYIARALAGEMGTRFMHIGLPDVLDMWLGNSERNVHELFETARANAPTVLFLDELDVLGATRGAMHSSPMHGVVAQLLVEMDGLVDDNEGLFVLGATNQPWNVDPAVRRPGRFDRMVFVGPPDQTAREAVLAHHLQRRPVSSDVDVRWLAERSADFSGADLAALVTDAAQQALMASVDSGEPRSINQNDLRKALKARRPSIGGWLDTAHNVVAFSDKSGEFADLADYLRRSKRR